MMKLFRTSLLLIGFFIVFSSFNHPIKLTSSEIKYNTDAKTLRVKCKVFIDDFAPAVSVSLLTSLNDSDLADEI